MSVTIITATKLKDMKDQPVEKTVGELLAEILWNSRENQPRCAVLAQEFIKKTEVELKAEDVVFLKKVMTTLGLRAGEYGQILELIESAKK